MPTFIKIKGMSTIIMHLSSSTFNATRLLPNMVGWAMMTLTLAEVLALINFYGDFLLKAS